MQGLPSVDPPPLFRVRCHCGTTCRSNICCIHINTFHKCIGWIKIWKQLENLKDMNPSTLLKFREKRIHIISDIKNPFQQIYVDVENQQFTKHSLAASPDPEKLESISAL